MSDPRFVSTVPRTVSDNHSAFTDIFNISKIQTTPVDIKI